MRFISKTRAVWVIPASWLALATVGSAIDYEWTNSDGDNDFSNLVNWEDSGSNVPTTFATHRFFINLTGGNKAIISADPPASLPFSQRVRIGIGSGDSGELTVSGGSTTIGDDFQVGQSGTALFTLTGGIFEAVKSYATIGQSSPSHGVMTITGGTFNADRVTVSNAAGTDATLTMTGGLLSIVAGRDPTPASTSGSLRMNSGDGAINIGGTAVVECESFITGNFVSSDGVNPPDYDNPPEPGNGLVTMTGGVVNITGSQLPAPLTLKTVAFQPGGEVAFEGGVWNIAGDEQAAVNQAIADGLLYNSLGNQLFVVAYDAMEDETMVSIRALTALEDWRLSYFGVIGNTGNAANDLDFEVDSVENLVEFGFGLNPEESDADQLPQIVYTGGALMYSFTEPSGVAGITYGAEYSINLVDWFPVTDTGIGADHVFSMSTAGKPILFLRLFVTEN